MLFSYKIVRDYGFAPNPFYNMCTLATCKPVIRERCSKGDWIAGFGGNNTSVAGKLVYLMKVEDVMTFDEYWNNPNYEIRKPRFDRSKFDCYGDNIYHHIVGNEKWIQENSHHSYSDGSINYKNLNHDTRINSVAVSKCYWYFGANAIQLPEEFESFRATSRNYNKFDNQKDIDRLISFMEDKYKKRGQRGLPFSWNDEAEFQFERFSGEKEV